MYTKTGLVFYRKLRFFLIFEIGRNIVLMRICEEL